MTRRGFRVVGAQLQGPDSGWRDQLVELLGAKPRRLSPWCELGLWGLLKCSQSAGHSALPASLSIRTISQASTVNATLKAMAQASDFPPMPFSFMSSQPGQLFNALAGRYDWAGDAQVLSVRDRARDVAVLLAYHTGAVLLGVVEDYPEPTSRWLWLLEDQSLPATGGWQPLDDLFQLPETAVAVAVDERYRLSFR